MLQNFTSTRGIWPPFQISNYTKNVVLFFISSKMWIIEFAYLIAYIAVIALIFSISNPILRAEIQSKLVI